MILAIVLIILFLAVAFLAVVLRLERWVSRKKDPYREGHPRYQKQIFYNFPGVGETLAGFKVAYTLELRFDRVDNDAFNAHTMLDESSRNWLARSFDAHRFIPRLTLENWFFHYDCNADRTDNIDYAIRTPVCGLFVEEAGTYIGEVPDWKVIDEVRKEPFSGSGCTVFFEHFSQQAFNPNIIEENYAMLRSEDKKMILESDRFGRYEEVLAVAALKRRLDFFAHKQESHKTEGFTIETEKAGRGLKIKWSLSTSAKRDNELLGFRKTRGFFADQFDEHKNGDLVVHASNDGETLEPLNEGEATFYTFFLKPKVVTPTKQPWSPLRFQITISTKEETAAIEAIIERAEERLSGAGSQTMSRALKELGLAVEFDKAIGQRQKILRSQIETGDYSQEEKEELLFRLSDRLATVRAKYDL